MPGDTFRNASMHSLNRTGRPNYAYAFPRRHACPGPFKPYIPPTRKKQPHVSGRHPHQLHPCDRRAANFDLYLRHRQCAAGLNSAGRAVLITIQFVGPGTCTSDPHTEYLEVTELLKYIAKHLPCVAEGGTHEAGVRRTHAEADVWRGGGSVGSSEEAREASGLGEFGKFGRVRGGDSGFRQREAAEIKGRSIKVAGPRGEGVRDMHIMMMEEKI